MKKLLLAPFAITIIFLFSSCSWTVPFYIFNTTNEAVTVKYELNPIDHGFAIFLEPELYLLNKKGKIKYDSIIKIKDLDPAPLVFKISVPAKSAVQIGHLNNDNYEHYDQKFINDRHFNLKSIRLLNKGEGIRIVPETFDDYFKKTSNGVIYSIE